MTPEDREFVESLNCWEDDYDVITDNIQKLSGLLSLQIQLLQNITSHTRSEQEEKENTMNDDKVFNPTITELKKEVQYIKDRYNAPVEVLEELVKKVHTMLLDYEAAYEEQRQYSDRLAPAISITKTIDVFKQQVDTNMFVYVGTMTDNVLTLNQSAVVLETHVTKPSTYFTDWFVKNNNPAIGCQWLDVHPSNTVKEILVKERYIDMFVTTGYLTDEGKVVYYDQYL